MSFRLQCSISIETLKLKVPHLGKQNRSPSPSFSFVLLRCRSPSPSQSQPSLFSFVLAVPAVALLLRSPSPSPCHIQATVSAAALRSRPSLSILLVWCLSPSIPFSRPSSIPFFPSQLSRRSFPLTIVEVTNDILKIKQDIEAELFGEAQSWGHAESNSEEAPIDDLMEPVQQMMILE
ncbi:hypothetical protein RIF29_05104 [Crotalaria pallida]|uniref:Uncharacterized protein n=1 Tax=Crotalaria pallida TaxID=3830 RepID=A0AAN9J1N3_CROPI